MYKKAQQRDYSGLTFIIGISFILAGVIICFLGNLAIFIGFGSILISVILMLVAGQSNNDELGYIGLFLLALGIILIIGGFAITSFFENNDVGRLWLGSGKIVINTTAETYKLTKGGLG